MVQLTEELVEELDVEASERGVSRSAVIREAVEEHFAGRRERSVGRRIVEGYRRVPPATPDEWGSLDEASDAAAREVSQRLDAEERANGHGPW
jgi:hypothetical protein